MSRFLQILRCSFLIILLTTCAGCWQQFFDPLGIFSGGGSDESTSLYPKRISDSTDELSLALGGSAPGWNEIIFTDNAGEPRDFTGGKFACGADDHDIISLSPREGFETQAAGSGVLLTPLEAGVTAVRCFLDDVEMNQVFEVTIPPQSLIQILVAEALDQLDEEATLTSDGETDQVSRDSHSTTAEALGSVIRNRIHFISSDEDPALFGADPKVFELAPPASWYDAVILAEGQFSTTDEDDPNFDLFSDAQDRNFLPEDEQIAYDQAVLTAAGIYNGDITDTTTGAFAFRTPSQEEWNVISQAWTMSYLDIPDGAGFSDATFPSFAPIQILIHNKVGTLSDGRPAFVFARKRTSQDFAVVRGP